MLLAGCPGKKRCEKRCEDAADTELAKSEVIQTGHICFFQLAVGFWVLGLPLFSTAKVSSMVEIVLSAMGYRIHISVQNMGGPRYPYVV